LEKLKGAVKSHNLAFSDAWEDSVKSNGPYGFQTRCYLLGAENTIISNILSTQMEARIKTIVRNSSRQLSMSFEAKFVVLLSQHLIISPSLKKPVHIQANFHPFVSEFSKYFNVFLLTHQKSTITKGMFLYENHFIKKHF
jgi:hypothetical protein